MDETFCQIPKQIFEHKRDLKEGDENNAIGRINSEINHSVKDSKMLVDIHNKKKITERIVESSIVSIYNIIKQRSSLLNFSSQLD